MCEGGEKMSYYDDRDLPYEPTQEDIDDCLAFINSMTAEDWENLHKLVEEELINDLCDDGDVFIFI